MTATPGLSKEVFILFRNFIEESCGISLGDEKEYLLEARLARLLQDAGCSTYKELYLKAKNDPPSGYRDKIVDAMTTNETLWFRDTYPFEILKSKIFPEYLEEMKCRKRQSVRLWSAACSSGQEPYSIVMTLLEFAKKQTAFRADFVEILATDISPSALLTASSGIYDDFSVNRGLPSAFKSTYFERKGRFWSIRTEVKKPVKFRQFNLQAEFSPFGKFDAVFCRNVSIYFSSEFKKKLFSKIAKALNPGGYLFLGGSESLIGLSDQFQSIRYDRGVYYKVLN